MLACGSHFAYLDACSSAWSSQAGPSGRFPWCVKLGRATPVSGASMGHDCGDVEACERTASPRCPGSLTWLAQHEEHYAVAQKAVF